MLALAGETIRVLTSMYWGISVRLARNPRKKPNTICRADLIMHHGILGDTGEAQNIRRVDNGFCLHSLLHSQCFCKSVGEHTYYFIMIETKLSIEIEY